MSAPNAPGISRAKRLVPCEVFRPTRAFGHVLEYRGMNMYNFVAWIDGGYVQQAP